jgi:hypothetical protein
MNKFFFCLMGLVLICSCASEPDDPHREALEQYAKSHIEDPESYQFDEIHLQFEYTYNTPLVEYRLKMQDYVEQPGVDLDALRAEDNQLQVLIDELGYAKVCNEYHLWFWCKDPATGEKQQRAVKARYDMDDNLIGIVITPDSFSENPAVRMLKDKGRLDIFSHPEWFPNK